MSSDHNEYQRDPDHEKKLAELQKKIEREKISTNMQFGIRGRGNAPKKEPGDGYVISGALIGFFVGAALGGYFSTFTEYIAVFVGVFLGLFFGALIGTLIGSSIKKRVLRNQQ